MSIERIKYPKIVQTVNILVLMQRDEIIAPIVAV